MWVSFFKDIFNVFQKSQNMPQFFFFICYGAAKNGFGVSYTYKMIKYKKFHMYSLSGLPKNSCFGCRTILFFYKNTLYKNIEAQIWYFEMGFSENICASFKLVIKTNRGHHKKRFKHIIEGGSRLKMC